MGWGQRLLLTSMGQPPRGDSPCGQHQSTTSIHNINLNKTPSDIRDSRLNVPLKLINRPGSSPNRHIINRIPRDSSAEKDLNDL